MNDNLYGTTESSFTLPDSSVNQSGARIGDRFHKGASLANWVSCDREIVWLKTCLKAKFRMMLDARESLEANKTWPELFLELHS